MRWLHDDALVAIATPQVLHATRTSTRTRLVLVLGEDGA